MGFIRKIRHPELFQGSLRRRGYFEGWYCKLITLDMRTAAAAIPGVALGATHDSPDSHAFVQFILGDRTHYFRYPLAAFQADKRNFRIGIGGNAFSREGVSLDLRDEQGSITGELRFTDILPFPGTLCNPGIMGPFGYVPFMQCYHGIVSIRHRITGSLSAFGQTLDFDDGSGYIEKDWGRAFPSCWIWVQANHFADGAAFLFSVAEIPWLGGNFTGFFAFLHSGGELRRFATYTGARLTRLMERDGGIDGAIRDRRGTIEFFAKPGASGMLKAPKNGLMDTLIEESLSSTVQVRLMDREGETLYEGASKSAGMEQYDAKRLLIP